MTETYKAGEIEVSVKLDTSALKGEFAALNKSMSKNGKDASKGFLAASFKELESGVGNFKSSVFEALNGTKEVEKAGKLVVTSVSDLWKRIRGRSQKGAKRLIGQFRITGRAMGGALRAGIASTGIGLLFEALAFAASKLFGLISNAVNKATIEGKKAGETLESVGSDIEDLGAAYNSLTSKTQTLEQQTLELNKAIDGSGSAAEDAAKKELQAIDKRIRKNKELQRVYLDDARSKLRSAREAEIAANNLALAEAATSFLRGNTNATARKLGKNNEYAASIEEKVKAEQERLREKRDTGGGLTKREQKSLDAITKYYKNRAENAQKVLEAEELVAALQTPQAPEPRTPANDPAGDEIDSVENSRTDTIPEKDCDKKCDDKVRRIEVQQKEAPEPVATKADEEAARQTAEEAERHRQRIERAKELERQAKGPIAEYEKALKNIREVEQDDVAKSEGGGDKTFQSAKLNALQEFTSAAEDYGRVLDELDKLLKANEITVEQYGKAFQDVVHSISDTDQALELLANRANDNAVIASPIKKDAIDEANRSLKTSEEYLEAINARKKEALELEAQEIENKLLLAEIGQGEPVDIAALRERLAIIRENLDLLQRGFSPEQAEEIAPKLVQSSEYKDLESDVKDLFKGGIKAAIDGDFEDFLADKLQGAADSMFDNAINTLLDSLLAEGGPLQGLIGSLFGGEDGGIGGLLGGLFGGGAKATGDASEALGGFSDDLVAAGGDLNGFGGALGSIFGAGAGITGALGGNSQIGGLLGILPGLFAGFFADGGVVPRGKFAIVGEEGPEIISSGASPLRVTPMNDNVAASHAARLSPDGGGVRAVSYAPVNNFYGHTQDDLRRSLDERDRALKSEMPGMMDRHTFNQRRGMA